MNTLRYLAWISLALAASANAQTQRTGDSNARAAQQLQQLSSERAQLKSENDKLKHDLESLQKQLATATSERTALQQRVKAAEATSTRDATTNQQNTESLEKSRAQMQELVVRFRETAQALKEVEADRNMARGQLQSRDRELTTCIDRNLALYQVSNDVLDRLENRGTWESLTEKEPFTKIQRNKLENLIDGFKERAAELRIESPPKK
jgi:chromosome segregation ATPase